MDIETFRDYCLSLKGVEECTPFDETTLVFKVGGKMFALCDMDNFGSIIIKCDPEKAIELRERHEEVYPGFHMNKKHWNSIDITGSLPDPLVKSWISDSYNLVVGALPRKVREELSEL